MAAAPGFIAAGCNVVLALPAYSWFSRARHASITGPRPIRDKTWPRGKPGLAAQECILVDAENLIAHFTIAAITAAGKARAFVFFACPEDSGRTWRGNPASLWQWQEIRSQENATLIRGAMSPKDWATEGGFKPTSVLTNAATIFNNSSFFRAWPQYLIRMELTSGHCHLWQPRLRQATNLPLQN